MDVDKQAIRRRLIAARQALDPAERTRLSLAAQEALLALPEWAGAESVLLYLPVRGEVDTAHLVAAALDQGKRLLLPRVERAARRLALHRWSGRQDDLAPGAFGIPEPRPDLPREDPLAVDLAVVPGVAFDPQGYRLGYGGGYYDWALPEMVRAVKIGLGYGFQVVPTLPAEAHDVRLDALATEGGVLRFPPEGPPEAADGPRGYSC
ncbi:MAG: 5-formyltetrahydrofolate cyclo-ligase [Symbiobacterium sp.]|uniref:5-formyltetrahydrofolate cyclo-ligase n=1 Tax=Symbiobacterium sp. TaxID=1971213 RepID=UPI0034646C41